MTANGPNKNIWRLIKSGPLDGPLNMAIDEAILEQRKLNTVPSTLRFYSWQRKYCSFGYSQDPEPETLSFCRQNRIGLVRRPTGGGLVLHDQEVTFSLVFSREELRTQRSLVEYYRVTTECFRQALLTFGLSVQMEENIFSARGKSSFCFSQPTKYDLLIHGRKICGSAQRRYRNIILQQGSLILALQPQPRFWDKAAGLQDFLPRPLALPEFYRAVADSFHDGLGIEFQEGQLNGNEEKMAARLAQTKYANIN